MMSSNRRWLYGLPFVVYALFCLLLVMSLANPNIAKSLSSSWSQWLSFADDDDLSGATDLPDFAAISQTPERKQQFLALLRPMVSEKNSKLLASRARLEKIAAQWHSEQQLSSLNSSNLERLRDKYHVTTETYPDTGKAIEILLLRVDAIPPAMVLAQAAVESGWGTSRFAEEAYNLFGQWCYTQGCGIVPSKRAGKAKHEVKKFNSVEESVSAYFNNINTHNAYRNWRQLRASLRGDEARFNGHNLVAELGKYSGRGDAYIAELRQVIRANQLE
jgi:Bax protein